MLDLRKLETFRVVALTRNFTRAAVELGCCQSTVTTHVQALERELGVPLFDRYQFSKTTILTEAGRLTLKYAERLLALANEAQTAVVSVHDRRESKGSPQELILLQQ
jgi:DNA-binding transcriptional LysR family regulator